MRSVKLDALEKGRYTNFTFLVGPDKEMGVFKFGTVNSILTVVIVPRWCTAFKSDLLMVAQRVL